MSLVVCFQREDSIGSQLFCLRKVPSHHRFVANLQLGLRDLSQLLEYRLVLTLLHYWIYQKAKLAVAVNLKLEAFYELRIDLVIT